MLKMKYMKIRYKRKSNKGTVWILGSNTVKNEEGIKIVKKTKERN